MIEITLTTIAAYGSFVAAEQLGCSGVIATVTAGMLCGNYAARTGMSPSTRIAAETFWEYVAFALNSIVFLLIGFEVHAEDLLASWQAILVAYLAVTLGRGLVILGVSALLRRTRERIPWSWTAALTWGGLRGALSMVLALSLVADFPQRSLIVTMTFGVVLLTILIQGTTMGALLKRAGLVSRSERRRELEVARGRSVAARGALAEIDRIGREFGTAPQLLGPIREQYEAAAREAEESIRDLHAETSSLREEESRAARRHLLLTEKSSLLSATHQGLLGQEAFERVAADIDSRLLQIEEAPTGGSAPERAPADE